MDMVSDLETQNVVDFEEPGDPLVLITHPGGY